MPDPLTILTQQIRRHRLDAAKIVPAASLGDTSDLVDLVDELIGPEGSVLSTCRNGVYRSSMAASALSKAGVSVVSGGTHSGLSYEFTHQQLQQSEPAPDGGLALPAFGDPINLLILCSCGGSQDELREIQGILARLHHFAHELETTDFKLLVLEGPEEEHLYY